MTKEAVGEWTSLMNVSLVFVSELCLSCCEASDRLLLQNAIFLAIVTAFIVPVLQELQAPSADSTDSDSDSDATSSAGLIDPHRQEVIQQWIAFFQISAFAVSVSERTALRNWPSLME
ncbi:hypothetical protein SISNIDRAFT_167524 [Sistotremastrum niveocremeum HHB9708]|uniref:DUF6535 domain-containing protein n=1 Tax=Sistotremastrum niveocremeum HHB9708 TaxID=1314777 RepID=A0A164SAB1_9AGAM|nr:hypothetical protein SISNIDRAFT_167524 [Sistotremastrum niveocremeum HHB9708]